MFRKIKFSTLAIFTCVLWIGVFLVADLKKKTQDEGAKRIYGIVLGISAVAGMAGGVIAFQKYQNGDSFFND